MAEELVLRQNTDIVESSTKKDFLEYYGVPMLIDNVAKKERISFLEGLGLGTAVVSKIKHLASDGKFVVEIPPELREAFKNGEASFINSVKVPGQYSPNIKIKGQNGIGGQITISEEKVQANESNLANIAVMAMVQSVLGKLEVIESKIDDVIQGQMNDRIGSVIGAFKGFSDQYPSFKSREDLIESATHSYTIMQVGLTQIHADINESWKILENAPKNYWQVAKNAIAHFRRSDVAYYQNFYRRFIYALQVYQRLLLLSDALLLLKGDNMESIQRDHRVFVEYCNDKIGKSFADKMDFLTNHQAAEIKQVLENNANYSRAIESLAKEPILVECTNEELKYLVNDGSKNS